MKIDGTSISPIRGVQAANRVSPSERGRKSLGKDQASVSAAGQFYQLLVQKTKELPDIREERVQELARQIEQGEFKIDPHRIARSLIFGIPQDEER